MGSDTLFRRAPRGYEQLTVSTVSIGLVAIPDQAKGGPVSQVVFTPSQALRYRDDGTAPTAAVGMPVAAGEKVYYDGPPQNLRFIRSGGVDAVLDVLYYS